MADQWIWLILAAVIVLTAFTAWYVWHGVKTYAPRRWNWYVHYHDRRRVARVRKLQAQGKAPPSVKIEIPKTYHGHRTEVKDG